MGDDVDLDADDLELEIRRVRELLLQEIKKSGLSVRAVERELGVAVGTRRKVLSGAVTLSFRNILEILKTVGVDRAAFFRAAYPGGGPDPEEALRRLIRNEILAMFSGALRDWDKCGEPTAAAEGESLKSAP